MSVFALSDLHLSHSTQKPMDVFGEDWRNHTEKIWNNWCKTVGKSDTVIIPGDISWGVGFDNSLLDLDFIEKLPGKKIIGKGNHDFWWNTITRLNTLKEQNNLTSIEFLYNNAFAVENIVVCGTRGYLVGAGGEDNKKLEQREAVRLRLSIETAEKLATNEQEIVVFLHYPPIYKEVKNDLIISILKEKSIKRCYYGHLHGVYAYMLTKKCGSTSLFNVSADFLNFSPVKVN